MFIFIENTCIYFAFTSLLFHVLGVEVEATLQLVQHIAPASMDIEVL